MLTLYNSRRTLHTPWAVSTKAKTIPSLTKKLTEKREKALGWESGHLTGLQIQTWLGLMGNSGEGAFPFCPSVFLSLTGMASMITKAPYCSNMQQVEFKGKISDYTVQHLTQGVSTRIGTVQTKL